jgi:hypothetical protein
MPVARQRDHAAFGHTAGPRTVIAAQRETSRHVMTIVFSEFPGTRHIAVLLSKTGRL